MSDNNWRQQPGARAMVYSCCWLLLVTPTAPLHAAPPANALPQIAPAGVSYGNAVINTAGNSMNINQNTAKAILNWKSFNIGKDAKVQFNQPSVNATALNLIQDGSASQIFGQLSANGNIYLINNNGILFGQGAQVNVHGLVASTLNVDTNQFVNSSMVNAINDGKAALEGGTATNATIVVEAGAKIAADTGGQVLMFAPVVVNGGEISTPDGQAILAASKNKVYLMTSNNDPNLRGLLVEVDSGGDVTNVGSMVAERGNITLLGLAVNQRGRVRATSSVDVNGSIRLLARDKAELEGSNFSAQQFAMMLDESKHMPSANTQFAIAKHTGTVTFGAGSVTEVVADTQLGVDGKVPTAPDAQTQNHSRIDAMAKTVVVEEDAALVAKGGRISLTATTRPEDDPSRTPARNDARVYIGRNATLDVSGEHVELPMERRLVEVELRGDELKDAPLQRNGKLRGKKVIVDVATGSPLISDLGPSLARVRKDVRERMTEGGTINLRSQGEVVLSDNALLDTRGGSVTYAAGMVNTSKLVTKDGWLVDIGSANPEWTYAGILGKHDETHVKWGTETYGEQSAPSVGIYREKFTEGRNAGALNIDTQLLYGFDLARIEAGVKRGETQRSVGGGAPQGGAISIVLGSVAGTVQEAVLDRIASSATIAKDEEIDIEAPAHISATAINASGAGSFSLRANGHVDVKSGAAIELDAGSKFSLTGTSMDFAGSVRAPSGTVALATVTPVLRTDNNDAQPLNIAAGSRIDVGGTWINDLLDIERSPVLAPLALNGGSIALTARGDLDLAAGSSLLANAGAQLSTKNAFKGGAGGNIKIATNARTDDDSGSVLAMNGHVEAYGYTQGGKLAIEANGIAIGGPLPGEQSDAANILNIDPLFLTDGGFADFTFTANLVGLEVAPGTVLAPVQKNLLPVDRLALARVASNTSLEAAGLVNRAQLDDYQRNPVNLHLNAVQTVNRTDAAYGPAYVRVGEGARIDGGNGARIDLATTGNLFVDGSIVAHGGAINLGINATPTETDLDRGYIADQALWLGRHAMLDASATIERAPTDPLSYRIFDGGSIQLTAQRGFIVAEPGSVLDVSAPEAMRVALPYTLSTTAGARDVALNPAAGSIAFRAAEGIASFATLRGQAAGDGRAGRVSYLLDGNDRAETRQPNFEFTPLEIHLAQLQDWRELAFGDALPETLHGMALVSADTIANGGFGSLDLGVRNKKDVNGTNLSNPGRIVFDSDVALGLGDALTLGTTNIDVADHNVALQAAAVTLGSDFWESGGTSQIKEDTGLEAGKGHLLVDAKALDVVGNVGIKGAAGSTLRSAGDLRFRSVVDGTKATGRSLAAAELSSAGSIALQAVQIYPTTLSDYTVRVSGADSVLSTRGSDGVRAPVFSAGAKLTLKAPKIEHAGVLSAPLGTVALDASDEIHLAAGSTIDVSAHDLLIPFGRLRGGELNWIYPILASEPLVVDNPPQKSVALTAPNTRMDKGAVVDLSGGGDIYAFEQIPGPGGSKDFLDVANAKGAFAVIPALGSLAAPYDTIEMSGTGIALGDTVWLDGSSGLPAGNYAVLPAHYALLPGAYLVTPQGASSPVASLDGTLRNGAAVVSGRLGRGLSGQYDAGYQSFSIETGSAVRQRSEYKELTGAQFYKDKKVDLAADAGRMAIAAQDTLVLNGTIDAAAKNGRGAQLDIIADRIAVVADAAAEVGDGVVKLVATGLNNLGVDSLLLGGRRSRAGDDTAVQVLSSDVRVESGATLQAPDVILAARDSVEVAADATVSGRGKSTVDTRAFLIEGDGALLRASSGAQANVLRTNSSGAGGDLRLDARATLTADKSMLLDSSGTMALPGRLAVGNGALNISTNRISLGDVPAGTSGVALSNAQLSAMQAQTLRLSSRSSLDFFGDVTFLNQTTELNSPVLRNMAPGTVRVSAASGLQLENGVNSLAVDGAAVGGGKLVLEAKNIALGRDGDAAGTMRLEGFDSVQLGSEGMTQAIAGLGDFTLRANAVTVYADRLTAAQSGANTRLLADNSVVMRKAGASVPTLNFTGALGGALTIEGSAVELGTRIDMASGNVALRATGSDASDRVALLAGGEIDVGGRSIALQHATMNTSGGTVKLASASGNVETQAGSTIRFGGAAHGGDAGALNISAVAGQALLGGALAAAKADGQRGASIAVDSGSLDAIDALLDLVGSSGIDYSVALRARSGDVAIARNLRARNIDIAADAGALSLASTLDASGANGGRVALNSRDDLQLLAGARIDAHATDTAGRGGRVDVGSTAGALRLGGRIDVGGGAEGRAGQVGLRVARGADNTSVPVFDNGLVVDGAERVQLAAVKTYDSGVVDSSLLEQARLDATDFMLNEDQIKAGLGGLVTDRFHLVPEIEVRSSGDLAVTEAIDFVPDADGDFKPDTTWRFGSNLEAPILTLRAAGNLDVFESIGDGVFSYKSNRSRVARLTSGRSVKLLLPGDSASYRLVAGAALDAANPEAVGGSGNITVRSGADVVTGTGSVTFAAGGDIVVDSANSLIASLGRTSYSDYATPYNSSSAFDDIETLPDTGTFNAIWATIIASTLPQYPHQGGDVAMRAGGDISYAAPTSFFSSWLQRVSGPFKLRASATNPLGSFDLTEWGAMLDFLKEGVVALGGGNVDIAAGGSITNLNAALPSSGKQVGVGVDLVEITRSGNLSVTAGGDILSPRLLVDNGTAALRAGGNIDRKNSVDADTGETVVGLQAVAVLGDATLLLRANGNIGVDAIFNSTVMPLSKNQTQTPGSASSFLRTENYFFTYGDTAAVAIESVRGDVAINNDTAAVLAAFNGDFGVHSDEAGTAIGGKGAFGSTPNIEQPESSIFALYPGKLSIEAASGDIELNRDLFLFPKADGQLSLLAGGDIRAADNVKIRVSDADPTTLPSLYHSERLLAIPDASENSTLARLFGEGLITHADTPVHLHDDKASIIDAAGDILSGVGALFDIAEATWISARDIVSSSFSIQNSRTSDVSEIVAKRDILYPLIVLESGSLQTDNGKIEISGPGRLDVFAGRDVELGTSQGLISNGNQNNPHLPDSGADISVYAGINGATAMSDPTLFNTFVDSYLTNVGGPSGNYIDWFGAGNFSGDTATLLTVFTGKNYASREAALADFANLPVLTKQAIGLEAWRSQRSELLAKSTKKAEYAQNGGLADTFDYSADLVDFVSFDRFGGDLRAAVSAVTQVAYGSNEEAATAMAGLSSAQQYQVAKTAFLAASPITRREFLSEIFLSEVRLGGGESLSNLGSVAERDGLSRSYAAIERMFPGTGWQGDVSLVFSALRTLNDGDINIFVPGGKIDVGLAGQFAGFKKTAGELGIIAQRYGAINGFAAGDININQSRISSLDGAGITLVSTDGDIDAGRGAKSALSIPPPKVKINDDGSVTLVFDAAVSGSGIQSARNNRKSAADRGVLISDANGATETGTDSRTDRDRYHRSLKPGDNFLFAFNGVIDAGDAGIDLEGGTRIIGPIIGEGNIKVGAGSIGLPTSTAISAGTLSLGNVASTATGAATGSINDSVKDAAAAAASGNVAFVTVDILGTAQ